MLLQFSVENFKSIKDKQTLDMVEIGTKHIQEHKKSLIEGQILPLAVIYGPNGGGKSNLLQAINYMQNYIARFSYTSGGISPVLSFAFDNVSKSKPTFFEVVIVVDNIEYKYSFEIKGTQIVSEYLYTINAKGSVYIFSRDESGTKIYVSEIAEIITDTIISKVAKDMPLLLYIRQYYDISPIKEIVEWFSNVFYVDYGLEMQESQLLEVVFNKYKDKEFKKSFLDVINRLGVSLVDFDIRIVERVINATFGQQLRKEFDIRTIHEIGGNKYRLSFLDESQGTKKIFGLVPMFMDSLQNGKIVIIDELDAKLHPLLLKKIMELYSDKDINVGGGQLIFTSHDMVTLDSKLLRRDEIYFMCLNDVQESGLFSLVEIRGRDGKVVRRDGNISKQYLEGRYGADPHFQKIMAWE